STVVGNPGRVKVRDGVKISKDLNHCDLPDPIADRIKELEKELLELKGEVETLRNERSQIHGHSNL
ncbi:hypothetical protein OSK38_29290, partial [Escherichia coli]|nr:hypothetical protein [Escherichia coli]